MAASFDEARDGFEAAWRGFHARPISERSSLLGLTAELLCLFRLLLVDRGELIPCLAGRPQQFVELRVYGLSIPVFRSLDKQCHQQRCYDRHAIPPEAAVIENQPEHRIDQYDADETLAAGSPYESNRSTIEGSCRGGAICPRRRA
jgi:hypothetical protein